jgi:predicted HicB family RNase H-like nuclease
MNKKNYVINEWSSIQREKSTFTINFQLNQLRSLCEEISDSLKELLTHTTLILVEIQKQMERRVNVLLDKSQSDVDRRIVKSVAVIEKK